jgi:hypothetical protein
VVGADEECRRPQRGTERQQGLDTHGGKQRQEGSPVLRQELADDADRYFVWTYPGGGREQPAAPAISAKPPPQTKPMLSSDMAMGNCSRGNESVRME